MSNIDDPERPAAEPYERSAESRRFGHEPAFGVGMVERLKAEDDDPEDPPQDASLLLQVASGFVFSLFVVLIGLMAIAVIRQKPLDQAIPAGGAKFVIGIGLVLLALLVAATRVRNKAANNMLVGVILGVAAIGLAVVAGRAVLMGILEGR